MSKTFKTAKKPQTLSPDKIAAFESGGIGHDAKTTNAQNPKTSIVVSKKASNEQMREPTTPQNHTEPTKRLSLDLPETMHRRFKTACSATDTKMAGEVITMIEKRISELEAKVGISKKSN